MPKFTVLCRQDAYVDYTTEVEAETAEEAAWKANRAPWEHKWREQGVSEFDGALYVAIDAEGNEIEGTECGKCA